MDTSQRGVSEAMFAENTGTDMRQNLREEIGARLSGRSNEDEARASIGAYAKAVEQRRNGQFPDMVRYFDSQHLPIDPELFTSLGHEKALEYVVGRMHEANWKPLDIAATLEGAGLTSGGFTNYAMHPDEMRKFNDQADPYAKKRADNAAEDLKFKQEWEHVQLDLDQFKQDVQHDLMPWMEDIDGLAKKLDDIAKGNPDLVRDVVAVTAVVVALGTLFSALLPILVVAKAMKNLIGLGAPGAPGAPGGLPSGSGILAFTNAIDAYEDTKNGKTKQQQDYYNRSVMNLPGLSWLGGMYDHVLDWWDNKSGYDYKGDPYKSGRLLKDTAANQDQYSIYARDVARIEHARYDQMGGSGKAYAGRYQMSRAAIEEAARALGEKAPTTEQFLHDASMQERFFEVYSDLNARFLSRYSSAFRGADPATRLAILGYAHNQGRGAALHWLETGQVGQDGNGTPGTAYSNLIRSDLNRLPPPGAQTTNHTTSSDNSVTINGNVNVNANDAKQMAASLRSKSMSPSSVAAQANSGIH